jgi:hypothetical protein
VREFQQSLPPTRQKTYLVLLIVRIVALFWPIIDMVVPWPSTRRGSTHSSEMRRVFMTMFNHAAPFGPASANLDRYAMCQGICAPRQRMARYRQNSPCDERLGASPLGGRLYSG